MLAEILKGEVSRAPMKYSLRVRLFARLHTTVVAVQCKPSGCSLWLLGMAVDFALVMIGWKAFEALLEPIRMALSNSALIEQHSENKSHALRTLNALCSMRCPENMHAV